MTWWSLSLIVESWIYLSIQHHLHFLQMLWQCTWFIDIYLGQLSSLVITFNERSSCWPRMMFECNARSTQVLSIHKALSIQAHPDKTRAAKLHADASPNFELGRLDIGRLTAWSWDKRSLSQDREQSVYICTYKVNQLYMYNCVYIYIHHVICHISLNNSKSVRLRWNPAPISVSVWLRSGHRPSWNVSQKKRVGLGQFLCCIRVPFCLGLFDIWESSGNQ